MVEKFRLEERLEYLKEHGNHSMSYSTLQPNMQYFDMPGIGYLAFMQKGGTKYVLANPICANEQRDKLVGEFLQNYSKTAFVQITRDVAEILNQEFNFYATQMGIESWFDLKQWNTKGKRKKLIRKYRNKANELGIKLREMNEHDRAKLEQEIGQLKTKWRKDRRVKNNNISFLVRPETSYEPYTKKYGSFMGDNLVGYVVCDPLWEEKSLVGYNINLTFYDDKVFKGLNYFNVSEILFDLQQEGFEKATLGYSPLRDIKETGIDNPGLANVLSFLYNYGNRIYNFKGLAQHKKEYRPEEIDVFYSSRKNFAFGDLFNVLKLSKLI